MTMWSFLQLAAEVALLIIAPWGAVVALRGGYPQPTNSVPEGFPIRCGDRGIVFLRSIHVDFTLARNAGIPCDVPLSKFHTNQCAALRPRSVGSITRYRPVSTRPFDFIRSLVLFVAVRHGKSSLENLDVDLGALTKVINSRSEVSRVSHKSVAYSMGLWKELDSGSDPCYARSCPESRTSGETRRCR